jgi:hypothetical protein
VSLRSKSCMLVLAGVVAGAGAFAVTVVDSASAATSCAKVASPTGSDSNRGSASSPYRTAQRLVSSLASGQTGCLNAGTYKGNVSIGTAGVTLRSTPGSRATLSLLTLEIRRGANDVTVSHLRIVGGGGALTMRPYADRFHIVRDDITNNNAGMTCIIVGGGSVTSHGGEISLNRIHNCGASGNTLDHGIYAANFAPGSSGGPGLTISQNVFYQNAGYSVQLYPYDIGALVAHNVMDGGGLSVRGGIVIDGSTAQNDTITQNVITYTKTGAVVQKTGSGHVASKNCFWQNPSNVTGSGISQTGNVTADPMFVNRGAADYRLSSGSRCLSVVGSDTAAAVNAAQRG